MVIKSVNTSSPGTVLLLVSPDGKSNGEVLRISENLWREYTAKNDVSAGMSVTEYTYDTLKAMAEKTEALKEASRLVGSSDRSVYEITNRLKRKGHSQAAVKYALSELRDAGCVNERETCMRLAERDVETKHHGRIRVVDYLMSRGYDRSAVHEAADSVPAEKYREALLFNVREKYAMLSSDDISERRRAVAAVARMGFTFEEILSAQSEIRKEKHMAENGK